MQPLIYIGDGKLKDLTGQKFDTYIGFFDKIDDKPYADGFYCSPQDLDSYLYNHRPRAIRIGFDTQAEFEYLIERLSPFVSSIYLHTKSNKAFDLSPMETCSELEVVQMYWNTKQEHLWDVKKNTKLKHFQIMDFYRVSDFSDFRGSSIEDLRIFGCNRLSSFVSKVHLDDPTFICDMPMLRELHLDIIKDENSTYYLELFAKLQNLHQLSLPSGFFTFYQFAWLKAHMPNVTAGLDCIYSVGKYMNVIGKRMPGAFEDQTKAAKYQAKYDSLVHKYKNQTMPPEDGVKN